MSATTDIIYIIDRSGSMGNLMDEAISGFNAFIDEQKKTPGECYVTLVTFNTAVDTLYHRAPLHALEPLTSETVFPRGATALLDAIGSSISDVPKEWNVIVCIMTDGHENVSMEWSAERIKALIEARQAAGWEFQFAGVGIDAFAVGTKLGFSVDQIQSAARSAEGMKSYSSSHTSAVTSYRVSK